MVDTEEVEYFWILKGDKENPAVALSRRHVDEYLFLIDKFLDSTAFENKESISFGNAHSVKHVRIKFSSVYLNSANYLSLNNCVLGNCSDAKKSVVVLDRENTLALRKHLIEYASNKISNYLPFNVPSVGEGYARLYIYRLRSGPLGSDFPIQIDGKKIGSIATNSALPVLVKSGEHEIRVLESNWIGVPGLENKFKIEPGKNYFIKYAMGPISDIATGAMLNIDADDEVVKNEIPIIAQYDLVNCKILPEVIAK